MQKITINRVNYSEIFNYATEHYGINWNPCNNLFFHTLLEFRRTSKWYIDDLAEYIENSYDEDKGEIKEEFFNNITKEKVLTMEDSAKAATIMIKFMMENKIDEMEVVSD